MYCAHKALNAIPEFRTRIVDGAPVIYDVIHVGTTIGRPDGSFGFAFSPFTPDFEAFANGFKEEIDRVNHSTGLRLNDQTGRDRFGALFICTLDIVYRNKTCQQFCV